MHPWQQQQLSLPLRSLSPPSPPLRSLCELNVKRQVFSVCTSPVVQAAWAAGQEVAVYGVIYDLSDGLLRKLVGPISGWAARLCCWRPGRALPPLCCASCQALATGPWDGFARPP